MLLTLPTVDDHQSEKPPVKLAAAAVYFAAFVVFGALGLRAIRYNPRIVEPGPFSSMDSALAAAIGVTGGSAKIKACFETLRSDRPVLVVFDGRSSRHEMVGQITAVLGWPRQVWLAPSSGSDAREVVLNGLVRDPGAFLFAGVAPPPGLGRATEIGGGVVFVSREESR